jgi:hypothetical protein
MTQFREFMRRSSGNWDSTRRYVYTEKNVISNLKSNLTVDFVKEDQDEFQVDLSWETYNEKEKLVSEGSMITVGNETELKRNVGYMTDDATVCSVKMIDDDCVVFNTEYGGMRFREEIRLVENDSIRLRQTLGFKNENDLFLVGQYLEKRV